METLEWLLSHVRSTYPTDALAPGVVLSCLSGEQWYVSVARYLPKKTIVVSLQALNLQGAIDNCTRLWCASVKVQLPEWLREKVPDRFNLIEMD